MQVPRALRTPLALDMGLALLLVGASVVLGQGVFFDAEMRQKAGAAFGSPDLYDLHLVWWWVAAVPAVVAILIRWRWPVAAFVLAGGSALAHALDLQLWVIGLRLMPVDFAALITVHTLATVTRRRSSGLVALVVGVAAFYLVTLVALVTTDVLGQRLTRLAFSGTSAAWTAVEMTALPALFLAVAWAVGDNVRTHRLRRAESDRRAAEIQREQEHRAALAVAAERARITRELHDVVAHGMSVMVVQAQAAEASLRTQPDTAANALSHVIDTGRSSLAEMRRLLDVVRRASSAGPELAPQPGVSALPDLIDQVREAGTPVVLHVEGTPATLPAAVDLSAFRIVQEALTNTRRHAGNGATATVRLAYQDFGIEVEVADDGSAPVAVPADGNGLRGIAERVSALGGTVTCAPRAGGGFAVRAILPTGMPT